MRYIIQPYTAMNLQKYIKNTNFLFLIIVIILVLFVRLRLLDIPFERDEGEYAYAGQAILKGLLPYRDFYNMKMPNVYFVFALIIKYLGHKAVAIRLVTMCVNFANAALIYRITKTRFQGNESLIATSVYLLLSLTYEAQGWVSNSEHFVLLPALLGIYALSLFEKSNNLKQNILLVISGAALMTAFLTKQHAFGYLLFAGLWIGFISLEKGFKFVTFQYFRVLIIRYCFFGIGCSLPILALGAYLYTNDIFEPFYFLTFKYAAAYASVISPPWKYLSNFRPIFGNSIVHWLLFFATIGVLLSSKWAKKGVEQDTESLSLRVYLLLFFVCTFMCVWPGGYFRPHYFQLMFPASAILIGLGIERCTFFWTETCQKWHLTPLKLQGIALFAFIIAQFGYLFTWTPDKIVFKMYDSSFSEIKEMSLMLRKFSQPSDKISILGSEPQIFFYANRMSATGFLYHFPLVESQPYAETMSKQFVEETVKSNPAIFIHNHHLLFHDYNQLTYNYLQEWKKKFCKDYEIIGKIYRDLSKPYAISELRWKHLNQDISSDSLVLIEIFKRK